MQITYKFRLYPNKEQEEKLLETLELCRQTYNYFLAQWNEIARYQAELSFNLSYLN
ncbi:MAG: helix-turn-helix domain-containing protein [Thermoproteota archaeon]